MESSGYSSSTSLAEETPPRAASPPAAQPYQALSNQKLSVQAKKVVHNVYAQVRKSDPQLSVRAACRKVLGPAQRPRSYTVETPSGIVQQNRGHLVPFDQTSPESTLRPSEDPLQGPAGVTLHEESGDGTLSSSEGAEPELKGMMSGETKRSYLVWLSREKA
ncbi:hypothetical protein HPB50_002145 [Hyalomma asiaticum]|uniref:Uncharacterized protein n=1 Tax=Hyalomma asiaticum TaxID=266040 RepID=A0ACB7RQ59_HYAAI|nr:hypothetical protein HPB50_002145 [Hyalomma asiaticum]